MKAISVRISKGIRTGSNLRCIDNSGAKMVEVIAVRSYKGIRRKMPEAGVGDVIIITVKKGKQDVKHEVSKAVITTQCMPYRRADGTRIKFAENTAILIQDNFEPKGKEIKGVVAKEVVERFPAIGKIASIII